jgi:hypothetical protein
MEVSSQGVMFSKDVMGKPEGKSPLAAFAVLLLTARY